MTYQFQPICCFFIANTLLKTNKTTLRYKLQIKLKQNNKANQFPQYNLEHVPFIFKKNTRNDSGPETHREPKKVWKEMKTVNTEHKNGLLKAKKYKKVNCGNCQEKKEKSTLQKINISRKNLAKNVRDVRRDNEIRTSISPQKKVPISN